MFYTYVYYTFCSDLNEDAFMSGSSLTEKSYRQFRFHIAHHFRVFTEQTICKGYISIYGPKYLVHFSNLRFVLEVDGSIEVGYLLNATLTHQVLLTGVHE